MRFTEADVVRHPLVEKIVLAYELHDQKKRLPQEEETGATAD